MTWSEDVDDYIRLRRQLGTHLHWPEHLLHQFATHLTNAHITAITIADAIAFSSGLPAGETTPPATRASTRMTAVRGFADYMHALDPIHQVPPRGIFSDPLHRTSPYIYCPVEITAVIHAATALVGGRRARTYPVLFALLAATRMRVGEAIGLDQAAVDLDAGVLVISRGKGDPRLVPLHPTTTAALEGYAHWHDDQHHDNTRARSVAFFTDPAGERLKYTAVLDNWVQASTASGLRTPTQHPRMHDLRHTFAVNTLLGWYRDGVDVAAKMPALSIYLGHSKPSDTYWYISAVPELLAYAATRLENATDRQQGQS